ncbi:MAG: DNA gyrase subunit A [Rickettsiales bacterium]|jgi:DNA gyrase subunit A|nr:DNA gyrase subunit A [Rickettsiales bacterium]
MTEDNNITGSNIVKISIESEMKKSYLDYAMSVIVSRAIPDVCDGLKPVHRRILYSMYETGSYFNKPYKKSARIVGDVMGKYHPHGDTAIYDALVRMAQDFSMRVPLIDGQGNFGSMDGDSPAAMRYTESRLKKIAHSLLDDIDKETVDFNENYDGSLKEPQVLPAKYPNIIVNGAGGIAVGMATNIPPHNLGEVISGTIAYIDNNNLTIDEIYDFIPGPDFPTGGIIVGYSGARSSVFTGRGSVVIRAKSHFEQLKSGKESIIITEIPYQVNKAKMIEKIAELVRDKRVEGISDLRDESNKKGIRVVIELKRDANREVVLNQLFSYSQMQVSFGTNLLALNDGKPELMNVLDVIRAFVKFRENVVTRRTLYLLNKARSKAHLLIGLVLAVDAIDKAISIIRGSQDAAEARIKLLKEKWDATQAENLITLVADGNNIIVDGKCYLTETQVNAILDMKLARLTGLERDKLEAELMDLKSKIEEYLMILENRQMILDIIKAELTEVKENYATPRRSIIEESELEHDIEDLIAEEDMVVTVSVGGYIKRVSLDQYKAQKRGGKGRNALSQKADDNLIDMFVTTTHSPVLFFSNIGKVYRLKTYKLPAGSPQAKGRSLVNILPLSDDEKITNILSLPKDASLWPDLNLLFATANGNIRRSDMADFANINAGGKIAIRLDESDSLIGVQFCNDESQILLASKFGKSIRFALDKLRVIKSRTSAGVRGMKLVEGNKVISLTILNELNITREQKELYLSIALDDRKTISSLEEFDATSIPEIEDLPKELIYEMAQKEEYILTITENGYGKRTSSYEYRSTNRGGSGIINIVTSERNGNVVASFPAFDDDEVIIMTDKGKLIRCSTQDIRIAGRNTQGVTILRTDKQEKVVSVCKIQKSEDESDDSEVLDSQEDDEVENNIVDITNITSDESFDDNLEDASDE